MLLLFNKTEELSMTLLQGSDTEGCEFWRNEHFFTAEEVQG